MLESIVSYV